MTKCAIVTLALGQSWQSGIAKLCIPSQQRFAKRNGCDYIVLDAPLDRRETARQPSWQKLLIPTVTTGYDTVLYIDSDVYIADNAPTPISESLTQSLAQGRVGCVFEDWTRPGYQRYNPQAANSCSTDYYRSCGSIEPSRRAAERMGIINGGVLAFRPQAVIGEWTELYRNSPVGLPSAHWEQPSLSNWIFAGEREELLDTRFNQQVLIWLFTYYPFLYSGRRRGFGSTVNVACRRLLARLVERNIGRVLLDTGWFLHFSGPKWPARLIASHVRSSLA